MWDYVGGGYTQGRGDFVLYPDVNVLHLSSCSGGCSCYGGWTRAPHVNLGFPPRLVLKIGVKGEGSCSSKCEKLKQKI